MRGLSLFAISICTPPTLGSRGFLFHARRWPEGPWTFT